MTDRAWMSIGGMSPGLSLAAGTAVSPDDAYARVDNADMTVSAPFTYSKLLGAPNNVTAELITSSAHNTDTAGNASCYTADVDMASTIHIVHVRLAVATWATTSDNIGVVARAGPGAFASAYSFNIVRIAGPAYQPYFFKFTGGAFVSTTGTAPAGANLSGPPGAGDILSFSVSGTSLVGKINNIVVATDTDGTYTTGVRGGWYLQQGAGANFRINGLWLNHSAF